MQLLNQIALMLVYCRVHQITGDSMTHPLSLIRLDLAQRLDRRLWVNT